MILKIFFILFLLICICVAVLKYYIRRTAPFVKQEQLLKALEKYPKKNDESEVIKVIEVTNQLGEKEKDDICVAFESGPDFKWMSLNNIHNQVSRFTNYVVKSHINVGLKYGCALEARDQNGNFQGTAVLALPGHSVNLLQTILTYGLKRPFFMQKKARDEGWGDLMNAKWDSFCRSLGKYHSDNMKKRDHWYLMVLGVVKSEQGKHVGSKLLNCVLALAKQSNHPVYLECIDENLGFYEKFGFRLMDKIQLNPKQKKGSTKVTGYQLNAMIWENKSKND
ncbi:gnat family acetyltransferase [Anaeramoeba flamelloides]|uniref:Gnat family acetyltransferase n=1 Tax=Anaeramoeba flamelloides TaxID=1746091 RepID=A0ABQ8XEL2_9EUKA|nr:gnat family acetyltransferase [Anaeramoeba flamelloides]